MIDAPEQLHTFAMQSQRFTDHALGSALAGEGGGEPGARLFLRSPKGLSAHHTQTDPLVPTSELNGWHVDRVRIEPLDVLGNGPFSNAYRQPLIDPTVSGSISH
jgi:hypothetical protein